MLFHFVPELFWTDRQTKRQTDRQTEGQKNEWTITQTDERTQRQSLVENQYFTFLPRLSPFVALELLNEACPFNHRFAFLT